jgi:hypothetical protein
VPLEEGRSYGYVLVPDGGLRVQGVGFPGGPRAAGKSGWYKLLVAAGCRVITREDFEALTTDPPLPKAKKAKKLKVPSGV